MSYLGPSLRRTRPRNKPWKRSVIAILLSFLVNALAVRSLRVEGVLGASGSEPRAVVLAPLSQAEWEANRRVVGAPPAPPEALSPPQFAQPEKPAPNRIDGQIVDVAPSKNATRPKDSRFVAEQDSTVEKETRSRYARPGYQNTLPKPSSPQAKSTQRAAEERERAAAASKAPGKPGPRSVAPPARSPEQEAREKLALRPTPHGDLPGGDQRQPKPGSPGASRPEGLRPPGAAPGEGGEGGAKALQLRPSAATYDRLAGGPAPDKLDGVAEGEGTFLNTRGWKYASYFNRISQAVREQWDPNKAMRDRDPGGSRFGSRDWFTLLVVKLDDRGSLKGVTVQRSSGLDFLDNAAVGALQRAQPFVNPPRGLADERGEIVFSYGFTLEGSFGLDRIFRRGPPE